MSKGNWFKRIVFVLIALAMFAALVRLGISTIARFSEPNEDLNLVLDKDSSLMLKFERDINLKGVRATGSFTGEGSAIVYIENQGTKYLVFDSDRLTEETDTDQVEFVKKENLIGFATNELSDGLGDDNAKQGIDFSVEYSVNDALSAEGTEGYPGYDVGYVVEDNLGEAKGFAEGSVDDENNL